MAQQYTFPDDWAASLQRSLPPQAASASSESPNGRRPFVTVTFATSLDSALALAPGVRTTLSGSESMAMTHFLRSRHSAILVGVSTLLVDDPSLQCRLVGAGFKLRPVIVDPRNRWKPSVSNKVLRLCQQNGSPAPFVITGLKRSECDDASARILEDLGGKFIYVPPSHATEDSRLHLDWSRILEALYAEGISSVMIEGGGRVINSLLVPECHHLVDSVIVTIAPVWLGQGGVVVSPERKEAALPVARLSDVSWLPMGQDVVLSGRLHD